MSVPGSNGITPKRKMPPSKGRRGQNGISVVGSWNVRLVTDCRRFARVASCRSVIRLHSCFRLALLLSCSELIVLQALLPPRKRLHSTRTSVTSWKIVPVVSFTLIGSPSLIFAQRLGLAVAFSVVPCVLTIMSHSSSEVWVVVVVTGFPLLSTPDDTPVLVSEGLYTLETTTPG